MSLNNQSFLFYETSREYFFFKYKTPLLPALLLFFVVCLFYLAEMRFFKVRHISDFDTFIESQILLWEVWSLLGQWGKGLHFAWGSNFCLLP